MLKLSRSNEEKRKFRMSGKIEIEPHVDYDGKKAYEKYRQNVPKTKSDEIEFVKDNAPIMVQGIEALRAYVEYIRSH